MNPLPGIPLYNQDRLSDSDFVENFVARRELVEALLNDLRQQARSGDSQHKIIVGSRGMGKSSLLRRIAIGVMNDEKLSGYFVPLRFREEQYNVIKLDAFWRNCGEALAEWCEANEDHALAEQLDHAIASPQWRDAQEAATAFMAACKAIGRRAILLIDNLDIVVDSLKEQECWALRNVLQTKGGPIILGAATHLLTQAGDSKAPFYEFFFPYILEPLSEAELLRCMAALAELRGEKGAPVKAILEHEPERLRALYALTGGNPRVLALIYQLLERADSETILADLEALLELVTPYYKARVEEYGASQQRAVIDAIALNWDPMATSAISEVTGVEVTTISSQLARLKKDGFIEEVATSGARAGYQLSERFLNIWYLMRHGTRRARQRLRWLTIFLTKLFSAEELGRLVGLAQLNPSRVRWGSEYADALRDAYEIACAPQLDPSSGSLLVNFSSQLTSHLSSEIKKSEPENSTQPTLVNLLRELIEKMLQQVESNNFEQVLSLVDRLYSLIAGSTLSTDKSALAPLLTLRALALGRLGRHDEEISAYEDSIRNFGNPSNDKAQAVLAIAIRCKGDALGENGRRESQISAYEDVITRFGDSEIPAVRKEVIKALISKGDVYGILGERENQFSIYENAVAQLTDSKETDAKQRIAAVLLKKSRAFGQLGRYEEQIAVCDQIVAANDVWPETHELVNAALFDKITALGAMNLGEAQIATCDVLIGRLSRSEPSEKLLVLPTMGMKASAIGKLDRHEEEVAIYDEAISLFGAFKEPIVRNIIPSMLMSRATALGKLGRSNDQINAYDDVVTRFRDTSQTDERAFVGSALINKGRILTDQRGELAGAEECLREALNFVEDPMLATVNLCWVLLFSDRLAEAESTRARLDRLDPEGLALTDAAIELAKDNFGLAVERLARSLDIGLEEGKSPFFEDLLRLLRLSEARGYGERLVEWFKASGNAERYAPVFAAFVAYVRGERFLLDVNPEVRAPARKLFDLLSAARRYAAAGRTAEPPRKVRARPRKKSRARARGG